MDLCPGTSQQECGRPLKSGEDLCPSCRSEKNRKMKEEVLWTLSDPFGLQRLILRQIKKKWMKKKDNI